jgi:ubiquinone/menaquinone biosynthesis C-methylase UbiE
VEEDSRILKIIEAYQKVHLSRMNGYSPVNHSFLREDVLLQMYEYMVVFRKAFLAVGWNNTDLQKKRVLEVGCAWGLRLNQLVGFNFQPENMYGIDLLEPYIEEAKSFNTSINYEVMSATQMRYDDRYFDFSFACVALSAMLDEEIIDQALSEMCRVSKDFVLIIDNFDSSHEDQRDGILYFKGVDQKRIEKLTSRSDIASVTEIGSFWGTSAAAWRMYGLLKKLKLESIAYSVAIRMLSKHSHKAFLISKR